MEDQDTEVFGVLVNWLYNADMPPLKDGKSRMTYIKAYILADRLIMTRIKNEIMDAIRAYMDTHLVRGNEIIPSLKEIDGEVIQPLHEYFVDQLAYDLYAGPGIPKQYSGRSAEGATLIDPKFLPDDCDIGDEIVQKFFEYQMCEYEDKAVVDPADLVGCFYHDHLDGEECKFKKRSRERRSGEL